MAEFSRLQSVLLGRPPAMSVLHMFSTTPIETVESGNSGDTFDSCMSPAGSNIIRDESATEIELLALCRKLSPEAKLSLRDRLLKGQI